MTIDFPSQNHYPALRQLWKEAFCDTDDFLDSFWSAGFSPDRCRCAVQDGTVVAALYWFDADKDGEKAAYLYAVATRKTYRAKGICRRLIEDTHILLQKLGYSYCVLVPGNTGLFAYYERLGYQCFGGVRKTAVTAGNTPARLKKISPQVYFSLTKDRFPAGSVILQIPALAFFSQWGSLYQGENCLLAAVQDADILYVQAFWGDPDAAPAVLKALGCQSGEFISLGGTEPYAMYYPLIPNTPPPTAFLMDLA